jgi:hypothetical protein
MAVGARMPETTGQTYQRYSPGTKERVLCASFQCAGTVSSGPVVFVENASTEPLKNSMWYAEAPGAGAHAKRRALGFAVSPTFTFWTRLPVLGTDGTGERPSVAAAAGGFCGVSADAGVLPTCTRTSKSNRLRMVTAATPISARQERPACVDERRSSSISRAAFESAVSACALASATRVRGDGPLLPPAARGSGRLARANAASSGSTKASSGLTTSRCRGKA